MLQLKPITAGCRADLETISQSLVHMIPADRYDRICQARQCAQSMACNLEDSDRAILCDIALQLCDWPLLLATLTKPLETPYQARLQGLASWMQGDSSNALQIIEQALLRFPTDAALLDLYVQVRNWQQYLLHLKLPCQLIQRDLLRLEPLGGHHLQDYAYQFYHPDISTLCCLPRFNSDQEWYDWLRGQYELDDQLVFAVLHRELGFIGSVSLIVQQEVGFFYYWIGHDFRGQGHGPAAVELLLNLGRAEWGVETCYAKVFQQNVASRRGLSKLGFAELDIELKTPHQNELLYRRGDPRNRQFIAEELHDLFLNMGSPMRPATPITRLELFP